MLMANGLPHRLKATPHSAIAQDGSAFRAELKPSIARPNSNECSCATARLNSGWACGLQDVEKLTVPNLSSLAGPCWCGCASTGLASSDNVNAHEVDNRNIMILLLLKRRRSGSLACASLSTLPPTAVDSSASLSVSAKHRRPVEHDRDRPRHRCRVADQKPVASRSDRERAALIGAIPDGDASFAESSGVPRDEN